MSSLTVGASLSAPTANAAQLAAVQARANANASFDPSLDQESDSAPVDSYEAPTPLQVPSSNVNPMTEQAPSADSLIGVATYNYFGKLQAFHPDSGQALNVSA
jgi:hypothetical protein